MAAEEKKVFDVSKPGKTKAEPTSKPVIIGHKVTISDGTVNSDKKASPEKEADPLTPPAEEEIAPAKEEAKLNPTSEKKLTPSAELVEKVKKDKASGQDEAKEVGETKSAMPESEPAEEPEVEKEESASEPEETESETAEPAEPEVEKEPEPSKPDEKPSGNEAAVNTVLGEAGTVKEAEIAELEAQEKVKKLVSDGKYELPIGQPRRHHGKMSFTQGLVVLLIVFVLTLAGFALAIDSGLIESEYELPFNLIK